MKKKPQNYRITANFVVCNETCLRERLLVPNMEVDAAKNIC